MEDNDMGIFFIVAGIVALVVISTQNNHNNRLPWNRRSQGYIGYDQDMTFRQNAVNNSAFTHPPDFNNTPGEDLLIDNGMGKMTRYLQSSHLRSLKISNGLGTCIVYYDNVMMDQYGSKLNVENGMGSVKVYIPPFYRFQMSQSNGLGSINVHGNPSMNPNDPLIETYVSNGLGKVDFYFG